MIDEIFKYLADPVNDSSVLFVLVVLDTILGVSWRIAKSKPIISNILFSGLVRNLGCACLPLILHFFNYLSNDSTLFNVVIPLFGFAIFCGLLQSVIANAVLCGVKIPPFLEDLYKKFFLAEQESKENRYNNTRQK